jgi:protein TonB
MIMTALLSPAPRMGFVAADGGPVTENALASPAPRIGFVTALLISLLLHGLPVGVWFAAAALFAQPAPKANVLVLDKLGIISTRQTEAVQAAQAAPPAPAAKPAEPKPQKPRPAPAKPRPQPPARESVVAAPPEAEAETAPAPAAHEAAEQNATEQEKRTIRDEPRDDPNVMARYIQAMGAVIKKHTFYPESARPSGFEGVVVVRVTITLEGDILPGSLVVTRSSGNPAIDDAARQAIINSLPLPKPPRQITPSLSVAFGMDRIR